MNSSKHGTGVHDRSSGWMGKIEYFGGISSLVVFLCETSAKGVLYVNTTELHLDQSWICHVQHPVLQGREAAIDILQYKRGTFRFCKHQAIQQTMRLGTLSTLMLATQQYDERQKKADIVGQMVVPDLQTALKCARQLAAYNQWHAINLRYMNTEVASLIHPNLEIIVLNVALSDLRLALLDCILRESNAQPIKEFEYMDSSLVLLEQANWYFSH